MSLDGYTAHETALIEESFIGDGCKFARYVNIYESVIDEGTRVASFVEIGKSAVGKHCAIQAFAFLCPGVHLEDRVFIGQHVCFTNDRVPRVGDPCDMLMTTVREGASIGAGCVIGPGVVIGENAIVGAGSVVLNDIPPNVLAYGIPAVPHRALTDDEL